MKISHKRLRNIVFFMSTLLFVSMDLFLIYVHQKMMLDSGISMGMGFLQLCFLILGLPLFIMFFVMRPSFTWWLSMIPIFILFIILIFK
jgi:4-amino-4-deoxy-L-arabinose transferase-like glycosyltransferase